MTTTARDADDYLTKAQESLASAESDLAVGRYNSCANRCYYACFQASLTALIHATVVSGQDEHAHDFVHTAFVRLITRRKLYPAGLGSTLPRLMAQRLVADYRTKMISSRDARDGVVRARQFVAAVTTGVG